MQAVVSRLAVVVARVAAIAAIAAAGLAAHDLPGARAAVRAPSGHSRLPGDVAAPPCWSGPIGLAVSAERVHPGELVTLSITGTNARLLAGPPNSAFATDTASGWRLVDTLVNDTVAPYVAGARSQLARVTGPVTVRIPDVAPGRDRLVRRVVPDVSYGGLLASSFPKTGATLCASVTVLSTVPALRGADNLSLRVVPTTNLHAGERVRVELTGFGAGGVVRLSQCAFAALATALGCGGEFAAEPSVTVGADGSASALVTLGLRAPAQLGGALFDCATNCVLVATLGPSFASATAALSFSVTGAVVGHLMLVGGPAPGLAEGIPGHITLTRLGPFAGARTSATLATASDGEFSLVLEPGRFSVSGRSPMVRAGRSEMTCGASPDSVVVGAHATTGVVVACNVK